MGVQEDVLFGEICKKNGLVGEKDLEEAYHILDDRRSKGAERSLEQVLVENHLLEPKLAGKVRSLVSSALDKSRRKEKKKERKERAQWSKAQLRDRSGSARRIGGYELLDELGTGAMGAVFQARQISLNKIVALKLLLPKFARDRVYAERFQREARAAARLNHPNIILPFDVGCDDGYHWIAMEYVPGINAREKVESEGPMDVREALRICVEVIKALGFAWKNGIIHRDVKPANIMLCDDGRVKLGDLGLARVESGGDLTQVGKCIGTPFYMAPEQAIDNRTIDCRCDIYSLGASLYHMVTGTVPFMGATAAAVLTKHITEALPDPREHRPDLPDNLVRVIGRMMVKDPEERYQTAEEVLDDLKRVLARKPVSAPAFGSGARPAVAASRGKRARKGSRTRRARAAPAPGGAALIAVGLLVLLLLAWLVLRPRRNPGVEPEPRNPVVVPDEEQQASDQRERAAAAHLRAALAQSEPGRKIRELRGLAITYAGTEAARKAEEAAHHLEEEQRGDDRQALRDLEEAAEKLSDEEKLGEALALLVRSRRRFQSSEALNQLESAITGLKSRIAWKKVGLETEIQGAAQRGMYASADSLLLVASRALGPEASDWIAGQRAWLRDKRNAPPPAPPSVEEEIEADVALLVELAGLLVEVRFDEADRLVRERPAPFHPDLAAWRSIDRQALERWAELWKLVLAAARREDGVQVRWQLRDGRLVEGRLQGVRDGRVIVSLPDASLILPPWSLSAGAIAELLGPDREVQRVATLGQALIDLYSGRVLAALEAFDVLETQGVPCADFRLRAAVLGLIFGSSGRTPEDSAP